MSEQYIDKPKDLRSSDSFDVSAVHH